MKILYIVSTPRSGSTVFEHALGRFEGIVNTGELRRLKDFYNEDHIKISDPKNQAGCTCGMKVRDCEFWNSVEKIAGLNFASVNLNSNMGLINRILFRTGFLVVGPRLLQRISRWYGPFKRELMAAKNVFRIYWGIGEITGCKCVVDSSKLIHQFLILKTLHPKQVGMVLMLRDGRAVSHSMVRGDRKKYFKRGKYTKDFEKGVGQMRIFRDAVLSWLRSTLEFLLFYSRISQKERCIIRYEEFCQRPKAMVSNIINQFDLSDATMEKASSLTLTHTIGGSPSRFESGFATITLDEKWKNSWTSDKKRIFTLYAGLVNRMLGYK